MKFSERQKLEREYYKWLDKNKNVKSCPFSVISFLEANKNLVRQEDYNKIQVLEKALEFACIDLLSEIYPDRDFKNYKPKTTMNRYIKIGERIVEEENEHNEILDKRYY